jgi:hypothetical protein
MKVVLRKYSGKGSAELFDALEKHKSDVEAQMRSVPGFVSYTLARSVAGGFAVMICKDQAGLDEGTRRAKDWVAKNAANLGAGAPELSVGQVICHLK